MAKISFKKLIDVLLHLGFTKQRTAGTHLLYLHTGTDLIVALPDAKMTDIVPASRVAAIRLSIIGRGIATPVSIDELLSGRRLQSA